jgi:hypothetical protein
VLISKKKYDEVCSSFKNTTQELEMIAEKRDNYVPTITWSALSKYMEGKN